MTIVLDLVVVVEVKVVHLGIKFVAVQMVGWDDLISKIYICFQFFQNLIFSVICLLHISISRHANA